MVLLRQPRDRPGVTVIELLIAMAVGSILVGAVIQTFVVSSRTVDQEGKRGDVHFAAHRALERISRDAQEAWAVLATFTVPTTGGWGDSGRSYTTTASYNTSATPEDDRFTVIFLLPSLKAGSTTAPIVLNATGKTVGAYDAVVWTFTETTRNTQTYKRRYDIKRSVYPAAALSDPAYTYHALSNSLTVGPTTYTLQRAYGAVTLVSGAVQATEGEQDEEDDDDGELGELARPAIVLKDRDGRRIGESPDSNLGFALAGSTAPASVNAELSTCELTALPYVRGSTARVSVTDVSLADFRIAVWKQASGTYSARDDGSARVSIFTSTNNRLRNKHDWQ